jgi:hypothetical protein
MKRERVNDLYTHRIAIEYLLLCCVDNNKMNSLLNRFGNFSFFFVIFMQFVVCLFSQ